MTSGSEHSFEPPPRYDLEVSAARADTPFDRSIRLSMAGVALDDVQGALPALAEAVVVVGFGGEMSAVRDLVHGPEADSGRQVIAELADEVGTTVYSVSTGRVEGWTLGEAEVEARGVTRRLEPLLTWLRAGDVDAAGRTTQEIRERVSVGELALLTQAVQALALLVQFFHVERYPHPPVEDPARDVLGRYVALRSALAEVLRLDPADAGSLSDAELVAELRDRMAPVEGDWSWTDDVRDNLVRALEPADGVPMDVAPVPPGPDAERGRFVVPNTDQHVEVFYSSVRSVAVRLREMQAFADSLAWLLSEVALHAGGDVQRTPRGVPLAAPLLARVDELVRVYGIATAPAHREEPLFAEVDGEGARDA